MLRQLLLVSLFGHCILAQNAEPQHPNRRGKPPAASTPSGHPPKKNWKTLNGADPIVVAKGGLSGLFPESSEPAYTLAGQVSMPGMISYCDLQITKDNQAFCLSSLTLQNSTSIEQAFPKGDKSYIVNGQQVHGWFAMDYKAEELLDSITLVQGVFSRSNAWDGVFAAWTPDMVSEMNTSIWINVQYDLFYSQHKLSPAKFILSPERGWLPDYISSPEINFLKSLVGRVKKTTKLIFVFLNDKDAIEPTTNQKYGYILGNLSVIKAFASGILVPKEYVWPVDSKGYLEPPTTLVTDAHKAGLEVHVSGFANDFTLSYNYSWDPTAEYMNFIDNSQFSVDGFLTDFPNTASSSIACLSQNQNATRVSKALVISHNGASGDYPSCTDLAYEKAMNDGADVIDCSVQMTQDGVAFCLNSSDLSVVSTAPTAFMDRSTTIPEIQPQGGIFSFDLTWSEIQSLKPQIENPFLDGQMHRNPAYKNAGKFVTLPQFLDLAKKKPGTGVLINIENAAYLASKVGLNITDTVATTLNNAGLDKKTRVMIQSDDSSVLLQFKDVSAYQKVLNIKNLYSDAPKPIVTNIKRFADAVTIRRYSAIKVDPSFTESLTDIVSNFHAGNVSVYIMYLQNEFRNFKFDYYSDPYLELNNFILTNGVDGIFTDYPASAVAYAKSPCADPHTNLPYTFPQVQAGALLSSVEAPAQPPSLPPAPVLQEKDITDPPLPPVANLVKSHPPANAPESPSPAESQKHSSSSRTLTATDLYIVATGIILGLLN